MSQENVEVVRQPIALKARTQRGLEERLYLRFPSVVAFVTRTVWRLPPRSRLRRAVLPRVAQSGFDAINRGDFRGELPGLPPRRRAHHPSALGRARLRPRVSRPRGALRLPAEVDRRMGRDALRAQEMLDLGDRLLFVGHVKGSGLSSGAGFESDWADLLAISAGRVIRDQPFFDRREALKAAGLRE